MAHLECVGRRSLLFKRASPPSPGALALCIIHSNCTLQYPRIAFEHPCRREQDLSARPWKHRVRPSAQQLVPSFIILSWYLSCGRSLALKIYGTLVIPGGTSLPASAMDAVEVLTELANPAILRSQYIEKHRPVVLRKACLSPFLPALGLLLGPDHDPELKRLDELAQGVGESSRHSLPLNAGEQTLIRPAPVCVDSGGRRV